LQLTQRPLKLSLVPDDKYPTDRLANADVARDAIKVVENMSEMAQFVYERYMAKMEELKGTLPTEEELQAMRNQLPQEDEDNVPEEASEEPPEKRVAKEAPLSKKKTAEAFKPTPILNEISVDEVEMDQREEVEKETTEEPTQVPTPAEES